MNYIRDYAMYAAVFGFFSFIWFGWAQEKPRSNWRLPIGIATGLALFVCGIGIYLSITNWNAGSVLREAASFKTYLITFYAELVLAGVGAFILIRLKKNKYVAPYILFIVGIHFISLKFVFDDLSLWILSALLLVVTFISPLISTRLQVANSAIAGIGAGTILLCFALLGVFRFMMA